MMPMLADLTGLEAAGLIGGLIFGGIGSLVAIVALFKKTDTQISPQPLNVEIVKALHEQFADKNEFEVHVSETRNGLERIRHERSEDLRLASESRRVMYEKQDALRRELTLRTDDIVSDLRAELNSKHKENTTRMDELPDRIIATLRNTGAIKHD